MQDAPFDLRPEVAYGVAEPVAPGVARVTANNPSAMTFSGTRSYLVGETTLAVIDPGPEDAAHHAALMRAVAGRAVAAILVTHSHRDHSPGARALAAATGAPVLAFGRHGAGMRPRMRALAEAGGLGGGEGADAAFAPDRALEDGALVEGPGWALRAVHTPGHLSNHLAFVLEGAGLAFTGDAAMGWSSTLVSPPDGDMGECVASLARLRGLGLARLLPGHGHPVEDPAALLDWQIAHRRAREAAVLAALAAGPADAATVAARVYVDLKPALLPAAARNALAHLLALEEAGRARALDPLSAAARFAAA